MIGKKINQLATELAPVSTDLTIIGDPISGVSKKITLAQLGAIFSGAVSFYTNLAGFPATGDINVIYCAKDTQKLYLWSGSAYVEVFPSQALLDTYQLRSEKGVSNGYASLDSGGKVPISQLPSSIMEYKGTWNAATNTPTLANGTGDTGDVYICNVAGTVNFGAGAITFAVGDYVIYSGSIWQRSSGAVGTVTSVAASITGNAIGITGSPVTTSGTLAFAFAGTGAQYIKGDGTLATFPSTIAQAERLITEVYNSTGATLTKGTIVYINGGQGNLPTVTKALATGDSTSAQTFGVVQADITNNNNGYVVVAGKLSDLDTQAYTEGTQLYLSSTTAGAWTSTKQYAPAHLVYVGIVVRAHPTQGIVEIKIQNGYEMDELHNVAAQTPSNNDGLFWESATSLWKNKSIATILGGTPVTGSGTLYALTKWGFTSGTIINSNLYDTGSVIYNNNATAGAFAVQFNGNATSGMSYGLLINAGSDANDIALRIQNVSSTSEYFFVYGDGKVKMNNIPNATTDTDTFLVSDGGFIKYRTGAQLLSDIGGQAALTNPVTGTGTTNYLPKFTGTSTIGNSQIFDNGTNVGINQASPTRTLDILGATGIGTVLKLQGAAGTTTYLQLAYNGATNAQSGYIGYNSSSQMQFFTNDTLRATLDASGNLMVGSANAGNAGTINVSVGAAGTTAGGLQLWAASNQTHFIQFGDGTTGAQVYAGYMAYAHSSDSLIFGTNGADKMFLNASGNLGLGVTPSAWSVGTVIDIANGPSILGYNNATFLINNAYYNGGYIYKASSFAHRYVLQEDGSYRWYQAPSGTAGNAISFTQAMTLNASGNLSIGNTNDTYKLDVSGTGRFTSSVTAAGGVYAGDSKFFNSVQLTDSLGGTCQGFLWTDAANTLKIGTGTVAAGNVKLTIASTGAATFSSSVTAGGVITGQVNGNTFGTASASGRAVIIQAGSTNQAIMFKNSAGGDGTLFINGTSTSMDYNFNTYSTGDALVIKNNGNVGIGTTSPSEQLSLMGANAYTSKIRFSYGASATSYYANFGYNSDGNKVYLQIADGSSAANIMTWNYNGNVGIGTTSPAANLQVAAASSPTIALNLSGSATSGSRGSLAWYNSSISTVALIDVEAVTDNVATNMLFYTRPASGSLTERMRITSGGLVGIGTSNPNVYGNGFTNQFTVSTTSGYANISVAGSSGNSGGIDFGNQSVRHAGVYGLDGSNLGFYTNGSNSGSGLSERMRITSGGNVGIGTTSPSGRLHILNASGSGQPVLELQQSNAGSNILQWKGSAGSYLGVLTNDGNLGIGTTSPDVALHIYKTPSTNDAAVYNLVLQDPSAVASRIGSGISFGGFYDATNTTLTFANIKGFKENTTSGDYAGALAFTTRVNGGNPTERMRITSGGAVRINSTTDINSRGVALQVSGVETAQLYGYGNGYGIGLFMCPNSAATGTHTAIAFRSPANGDVGTITTTSSSTSYNTTSDYRLKTDFKDFSGLDLVSKIKAYDYEWKSDKSRSYGVIAHELQSVINYAVTGVKDGEQMQGVDYSKIVPVLIKAIQELNDKIK